MHRNALILILFSMPTAAAPPTGSTPDQRFEALGRRFVAEFPELSPVLATQLGDHAHDDKLDQITAEARRHEVGFARRYLDRLSDIPLDRLTRANQVDAQLMKHELEATIWRIEELQEWAWNPLVYTNLAGGSIYSLVAREFAPVGERLRNVRLRLEQLPRLLEQVRATLVPERVSEAHARTAIDQNPGLLTILDDRVVPVLGSLAADERRALEKAIEAARAAIDRHQRWLEDELLPAASGEFRLGAERFDRKLAFTLHTPMSRQAIRQRAERDFERVRSEMFEVSRQIYEEAYPFTEFPEVPDDAFRQAVIRAALEVAYRDLPARDEIVQVARSYLEQTTEFVRRAGLVTVPDDPIEIILMPEFQRGVSVAYCDSPGPLDVGQKTFYAVAPLPDDWTADQVHSFLREYNLRSLQDLTIHEAMPGHYLQLAHSNRYPSTLRAVLSSGPFIEGWAVYAEALMVEAGYLNHDPLMRLIRLKWYLRAVTNAIIDQAIHVDGMTRDEAMKLMIEGGFQEEREAAGKWVRAQLTSTQLSTYFVGYQEHADLRRETEKVRAADFDLEQYHDEVLSYGSPPVQFVRALMLDLPIPR